jgi:hypothetical protein
MQKLFFILAFAGVISGCKKNPAAESKIEFYLLESFTNIDGKCQVNPSGVVLKSLPLVTNDEIISYSQSAYTYTVSDAASQKIKALSGRQPFAITIDGIVFFYGFYNPFILSSSCEHSISMDADSGGENKIVLRLGYPGLLIGTVIDDQRNNTKLMSVLKAQGKWRL